MQGSPTYLTLDELFQVIRECIESDPGTKWIAEVEMHPEDLVAQIEPILSVVGTYGSHMSRKVHEKHIEKNPPAYDWMSVDHYNVEGRPE